jgi:hypothetical protein
LIRDRESVLWLNFGFGLFLVSFGGSEVERLWKLIDLFGYELFGCGSALVLRYGSLILRGVSLGVSSDDGWCGISFLQWSFS